MAINEMRSPLRVFSSFDRTELRGKRDTESMFAYLDNSARPMAAWARELIEEWLSRYPPNAQSEWLSRFRLPNDEAHDSAFFELYCHEFLLRHGFTVGVHPLDGKTPDFLASKDGKPQFYLEATTAFADKEESSNKARLAEAFEKIEALGLTDFFVNLVVLRYGTNTLSGNRVCNFIQQKVKELDADNLLSQRKSASFPLETEGGWALRVEFSPKYREKRRRHDSTIGIRSFPIVSSLSGDAVRKSLHRKAKKYGDLGLPFVIAMNCADPLAAGDDIPVALYGVEVRGTEIPERATRGAAGLWLNAKGHANKRVSAVIVAQRVCPWSVPQESPVTWHHPGASRPIAVDALSTPAIVVDQSSRRFQRIQGVDGAALFDVMPAPTD